MTQIDDDSYKCHLLGGTFSLWIQVFIGAVAAATLIYKRSVAEHPRRPLEIWMMDVSKQAVSSVIVHFWNIGLAIIFSKLAITSVSHSSGDECAFYFISFFFDTAFGTYLVYIMLKASQHVGVMFNIPWMEQQGYYGTPPQSLWYLYQLFTFLIIIIISKFILGLAMYTFQGSLNELGTYLFSPFQMKPLTELVFVMVVCPAFMSIIQYWLQDNFLMDKSIPHDYNLISETDKMPNSKTVGSGLSPKKGITLHDLL